MRLVSIRRGITHYKSLGISLPYPRRSITKNGERLPRIGSVLRFLLFPLDIHDGVRGNATWWTRGELNPCPKIRWVGFLRGQSVMKFSRAGRKQTRDTAPAALFWMTGSRTKHRCTFPADVTHTASRRTLAGYGWRYATALRLGSQSDFFIVCV